jgi:putative restriction endonuclease
MVTTIRDDPDSAIRLFAFNWLSQKVFEYGDVLPRKVLSTGFDFGGNRVPLIGPQGIFKPKLISEIPLSITTSPKGPYNDSFNKDGFLLYRYRGTNPQHHENVGLRKAMYRKIPLVYFHGVVPGKYLAVWPVFIIRDIPEKLTFEVAADDLRVAMENIKKEKIEFQIREDNDAGRRAYITASVRHRLHQRGFRERVLNAYRDQCALCKLKHRELLDAAHIIPDHEKDGDPIVKNGICLCKLHHAAFDNFFIGIRPDYIIEVRNDVLHETDGPMLKHGLQGLHKSRLLIPRYREWRPSPVLLEKRWERFQAVA